MVSCPNELKIVLMNLKLPITKEARRPTYPFAAFLGQLHINLSTDGDRPVGIIEIHARDPASSLRSAI